jgi:hypothetical protein
MNTRSDESMGRDTALRRDIPPTKEIVVGRGEKRGMQRLACWEINCKEIEIASGKDLDLEGRNEKQTYNKIINNGEQEAGRCKGRRPGWW